MHWIFALDKSKTNQYYLITKYCIVTFSRNTQYINIVLYRMTTRGRNRFLADVKTVFAKIICKCELGHRKVGSTATYSGTDKYKGMY